MAADLKIGFVNSEKVMREAVPAVRAQERLEKEFTKRDQELKRMVRDLDALKKELEGGKLSETDRRNKIRAHDDLGRDLQRKQREFSEDFNQRRNEELASVLSKAEKTIIQIAESEKYDLILQDAVYYSKSIDITDKVVKALSSDAK
ncbi:MAG: OmpH family outer membrane protein [Azoarcus sp.]|nr:OmpH family outer membrane protein [Azoarcus sp.]